MKRPVASRKAPYPIYIPNLDHSAELLDAEADDLRTVTYLRGQRRETQVRRERDLIVNHPDDILAFRTTASQPMQIFRRLDQLEENKWDRTRLLAGRKAIDYAGILKKKPSAILLLATQSSRKRDKVESYLYEGPEIHMVIVWTAFEIHLWNLDKLNRNSFLKAEC
ncbi:hypothetical protein AAE478_003968 [Parahypoxylon ruwenzoriense]